MRTFLTSETATDAATPNDERPELPTLLLSSPLPTQSGDPRSMSTTPPTSGPGASSPGVLHAPQGRGPQRVLACVPCQQRKVKCERRFPCSNCVKHNLRCVPATPTLQRKRRFPERELLDRLRRHEELLRRNNIEFEPLHRESALAERLRQEEGDEAGDEKRHGGGDGSSASASVKSESAYETR